MKKAKNIVSVLGQDYRIIICSQDEINSAYPRKKPSDQPLSVWGLCDTSKKIIFIDKELVDDTKMLNYILRHEILHAIAYESGLNNESVWGQNEECIDFYAIQYNKIKNIFEKLGIED